MSQAEKCPVCGGSSCVDDGDDSIEPRIIVDCHGCGGKGWVEVGGPDRVGVPVQSWPVYLLPEWLYPPQITYVGCPLRGCGGL